MQHLFPILSHTCKKLSMSSRQTRSLPSASSEGSNATARMKGTIARQVESISPAQSIPAMLGFSKRNSGLELDEAIMEFGFHVAAQQ